MRIQFPLTSTTPRLPLKSRWRLTAAKVIPGYPDNLEHICDHVRKMRLDRGLNRTTVAAELEIDSVSLKNWEEGRTETEVRFYPRIIQWLGYNPLPEGGTRGERIRNERLRRGWSRKQLARVTAVDEATIGRMESDTPRLARRLIQVVLHVLGISDVRIPAR